MATQRWPLIVRQAKLLKLAVSDYIDRIADGRGLRRRVITQPRPKADVRFVLFVAVQLDRSRQNVMVVRTKAERMLTRSKMKNAVLVFLLVLRTRLVPALQSSAAMA